MLERGLRMPKIENLFKLANCYSGQSFIRNLERLEEANLLGGEIKTFRQDYCDVKLIPLNHTTMPFYSKIEKQIESFGSKKVHQ